MFGLAVLFFFGLYLALSIVAVRFVVRWAKRRGRSVCGLGISCRVRHVQPGVLGLDSHPGCAQVLLCHASGILGIQDAGAVDERESGCAGNSSREFREI
jgi:hypothetical protein